VGLYETWSAQLRQLWQVIRHRHLPKKHHAIWWLGAQLLVGLVLFSVLRLQPGFGQLFHRTSDFRVSTPELLTGQFVLTMWPKLWEYYGMLTQYLSLAVFAFALYGVFHAALRRRVGMLWLWSAVIVVPFAMFGKTVHMRYLLPAAVPFVVGAALCLEALVVRLRAAHSMNGRDIVAVCFTLSCCSNLLATSWHFGVPLLSEPETTPFVVADRAEYLEDWSSGQGIREVVAYINRAAQTHSIAVATEGSFGTLPDGITLFFHRRNVSNIYIEGINQPVHGIPSWFAERARHYDQRILVVNSHRMFMKLPPSLLLFQVCRPNRAPCLQVWDITTLKL
jgi:hypothetical protein